LIEKLDLTPAFAQSISALIRMRAFFASSVLSWIEYRIREHAVVVNVDAANI
jgi:hypothetical protein